MSSCTVAWLGQASGQSSGVVLTPTSLLQRNHSQSGVYQVPTIQISNNRIDISEEKAIVGGNTNCDIGIENDSRITFKHAVIKSGVGRWMIETNQHVIGVYCQPTPASDPLQTFDLTYPLSFKLETSLLTRSNTLVKSTQSLKLFQNQNFIQTQGARP